jgi:hypothetical protein
MIKWEKLEDDGKVLDAIYRARVVGGWLVLVVRKESTNVAFYPDANHIWDGSSVGAW